MKLIYPAYSEAKTRFKKAHKQFDEVIAENPSIDENSSLEQKVDFIKAFQELSNSYDAIVTYDDYNDEMEKYKVLRKQSTTLEDYIGVYNTVKGSIEPIGPTPPTEFKDITFFSDHFSKIYNVDSAYINKLLGDYTPNSLVTKEQVIDALHKRNKPVPVIETYNNLFDSFDKLETTEDIFAMKHRQFL